MSEITTALARRSDPPLGGGDQAWGSDFDRFLSHLVPGEPPPDEFDRALQFAALGSIITLGAALLLTGMPSEESINEGGFFVLGRDSLADIVGFAGSLAIPVGDLAICLLVLTGIAAATKWLDTAKPVLCVAQPIVGVASLAGSGVAWALVAIVVLVNLAFWVLLIAIGVSVALGILAGVLGAAVDG